MRRRKGLDLTKLELTDKQRAVLQFVRDHIASHGTSPTIREIGSHFGINSTNGVRTHLHALIKKGFLKKRDLLSRGLELVAPVSREAGRIPLVGSVPAGMPIDAVENIEGEVAVDLSFLPKGDSFALRVTGDSMKGAGILDGDMVLVKKQRVAQKGDIVVAIIGDEATVKRYFPEGQRIRLQPENDEYQPIIIDRRSREFRVAGRVVALLRKLDRL